MTAPKNTAPPVDAATAPTAEPAEPLYVTELTYQEVLDSVTGYDEIGLKQNLHTTFEEIAGDDEKPINQALLLRALIGVHRLHEGETPSEAWTRALSATRGELRTYFTPVDDNDGLVAGEAPTSESGKDEPRP